MISLDLKFRNLESHDPNHSYYYIETGWPVLCAKDLWRFANHAQRGDIRVVITEYPLDSYSFPIEIVSVNDGIPIAEENGDFYQWIDPENGKRRSFHQGMEDILKEHFGGRRVSTYWTVQNLMPGGTYVAFNKKG